MKVIEKRNKIIKQIEYTTRDHIYLMENREINIICDALKLSNLIDKLEFEMPMYKVQLKNIVQGLKNCVCEFYFNVCLPYNKGVAEISRVLCENFIILKFLLDNETKYTDNWFYFMAFHFRDKIILKKDEFHDFFVWESEFKKSVENDKIFERLIKYDSYGWAYPIAGDKPTLYSIAKIADCEDVYDYLSLLSIKVHSNNALQNIGAERFENDTFNFCANIAFICQKYLELLEPYSVSGKRDYRNAFNAVFSIYDKFEKYRNNT